MTAMPATTLEIAEPSLAQRAYSAIEALIVSGELGDGSLVAQRAISNHLGIGVTPVREALLLLAAHGLLEIVPRSGFRVMEIDGGRQLLLLETRRGLERTLGRAAALRARPNEAATLRRLAREHVAAARRGDRAAVVRLDGAYKTQLVACARNPYLARAIGPLHALSRRFYFGHSPAIVLGVAEACAAVMLAVAEADPDAAARASDTLLDRVETFTRAAMDLRG